MKAQNILDSINYVPSELQYMFFENIFKKMFNEFCITANELYSNTSNHIIDSVIVNADNKQIGLIYLPTKHVSSVAQKDLGFETVQELITEFYNHTGIYLDSVAVVNLNQEDTSQNLSSKLIIVNKQSLVHLMNMTNKA